MAKRLLIIDDSPDIVALLKVILMAAGYEVRGVMDGLYGMKEALAFAPHLIILDISFPAGGGLPLLERLKTNLRTKDIPVLILTALEDEDIEAQAFAGGAGGYLLKPVQRQEVVQEVNKLLVSHQRP
ncbi:MAG: response regulator [Nitrospirota bacterium]|nr:response regulator [Nitrospirota bacterium]